MLVSCITIISGSPETGMKEICLGRRLLDILAVDQEDL